MPPGLADTHNFELRPIYENLDYRHDKKRLETSQMQAAYDHLINYDKWIRERLVPLLEDPGRALESCKKGAVYGYKRTKGLSPILIINLRKVVDNGIK